MKLSNILEKKKIVLYGLGTETERTIREWNGRYEIIGLLDGFKTEGFQFGYPIVDIKEVVKQDNIVIIVVARPGSCKAIAKRIGELCIKNGIDLYDIRGKNLLQSNKVVYDFKQIKGYTRADMIDNVKNVDVVSFDLFDTLVVRNILLSSDVIELVNVRLQEKEICIPDFVERRIGAEKKLSKGCAPRLSVIYEEVLSDIEDVDISAEELAQYEFEIDCGLIKPRRDMIPILEEVRKQGKSVAITSESYYSHDQIRLILDMNGYTHINWIIVSCEYNVDKTSGLFEKLIKETNTNNILHIGDDIVADIDGAIRWNLKSFRIYSAAELLDLVGNLNFMDYCKTLSDRIRVGMFIATIFNSPFQFEGGKRIHVDSAFDIGFLFCAPMILDFVHWFRNEVYKRQLPNVWLCARDGYLLKKIYDYVYPNDDTQYFLTSRISAIRSGVSTPSDIAYVDTMKFSGEVDDNLKIRFGLDANMIPETDLDMGASGLMKYKKPILDAAKMKRENNLEYIRSLLVKDGGVAFFDFVAKGTSQMYIQKLVENELQGLYFLQLEPAYMDKKGLHITSFYTEEERENSAIFDNYYILETLLTSPEPSVEEFDENGKPIFANETRSKRDISCFMKAQEGILDYIKKYSNICPASCIQINKKLDEVFLMLIQNIEIQDKDFLNLVVEDPFFNRMTDITDILL